MEAEDAELIVKNKTTIVINMSYAHGSGREACSYCYAKRKLPNGQV